MKSHRSQRRKKNRRIVFKGTLEDVNRFFYKRGWTDGFPVMPPTEEAWRKCLPGRTYPLIILWQLKPRLGKATVEKIAVNAVMAGALPIHMPVLIASVRAMLDPDS